MALQDIVEKIDKGTGLSNKSTKGTVKTVDTVPDEKPKGKGLKALLDTVEQKGIDKKVGMPAPAEGHDLRSLSRAGLDNWSSYDDYMTNLRVDLRKPDVQSLNSLRADRQSFGEQLFTKSYQLLPNIAMGILENAGYLVDVANYAGMLGVVDTDYDNWFSKAMREGTEGLAKWDPIYRKDPNAVWDAGDSAWWFENFGGLAESIVEFGITGFGVGTAAKAGAKALAKGVSKGMAGKKLAESAGKIGIGLDKGSQLVTAASLAYTEGVMVGVNVYDTVYKEGIKVGIGKEEAKREASKAAATTVRMNMFNTALNYSAVGALFKSTKSLRGGMFKQFNRQTLPGGKKETFSAWLTRLKNEPEVFKHPGALKKVGALLREGLFESAEELVNEISQREGEWSGRESIGTLQDWEKDSNFADRAFEAFTSEEGGLAMTLGFLGGVGNTVVMNGIDNLSQTYQNMQRAKKGQEPLKSNDELIAEAYKKELEQLIEKGEELNSIYEMLETGVAEGDQDKIMKARQALSDIAVFSAFQNGTPDAYIAMLEGIEEIDDVNIGNDGLTEAEREGLNNDKLSPMYYKNIARQKINDIEKLQKVYDKTMDKFWMGDQETMSFAHMVFGKKVQIMSGQNSVELIEQQINQFEQDLRERLNNAGYEGSASELMDIFTEYDSNVEVINELTKDIEAFEKTKDKKGYTKKGSKTRKEIKVKHGLRPNERMDKSLEHLKNKLEDANGNAKKHAETIIDVFKDYASKIPGGAEASPDALETDALLSELDPESFGAIHKLNEIFKERRNDVWRGESKQLLDAMEGFKEFAQLTGEDYTQIVHGKALVKAQKMGIEELQKEYDELNKPGAMQDYMAEKRKWEAEAQKVKGEKTAEEKADVVEELNEEAVFGEGTDEEGPIIPKYDPQDETDYRDDTNASTADGALTQDDIDAGETNSLDDDDSNEALEKIETGQEQLGTLKINALSMAYLARDYKEVVDGKGDTRRIRTVSTGDEKVSTLYNDIESHDNFQKGDVFTVEIDPDFRKKKITSSVINDKGEREVITFEEWVKKENPTVEEQRARMPLVIKDSNGEIAAYIHDAGTAYRVGKDNKLQVVVDTQGNPVANFVYRRVVQFTNQGKTDNWAVQTARLKSFRASALNAIEGGKEVKIQITNKSYGKLIFNDKNKEGRYLETPVSQSVGPTVKIGVSINGTLMRGGGALSDVFDGFILNEGSGKLANGGIFMVLPTPVNNKYLATYVRAPQLKEIQGLTTMNNTPVDGTVYAETLSKVIEIYLKAGAGIPLDESRQEPQIVEHIKKTTGIDILASPVQLKKFFSLYVVDHAFTLEDGNAERGKRAKTGYGQFHIRTDDNDGFLSIRFNIKDSGAPTNIKDLKSFEKNKDRLAEVLNNTQFAVDRTRLGQEEDVVIPVLTVDRAGNYKMDAIEGVGNEKDGVNETTGYEEFVKQNLLGKIHGEEVTLSDGSKEWVYFDQPVVEYDMISEAVAEEEEGEDILDVLFGKEEDIVETLQDLKDNQNQDKDDDDPFGNITDDTSDDGDDGGIPLGGNIDDLGLNAEEDPDNPFGDSLDNNIKESPLTDDIIEKILPGIKNQSLTGQQLIEASDSVYTYILSYYDKLANSNKEIKASNLFSYAMLKLKEEQGIYKSITHKNFSIEALKAHLAKPRANKGPRTAEEIDRIVKKYTDKIVLDANGNIDLEANLQRVKDFQAVIDNFEGLKKIVIEKLGKIGIKIRDEGVIEFLYDFDADTQETQEEVQVEEGTKENYDSKAKLKVDPKNTAPWQIRLLLSRLPKIKRLVKKGDTEEFETEKNYLGLSTFVNYEDLYNNLLGILAGTPETFESIVHTLAEYARETRSPQVGALVSFLRMIDQNKGVKNPNQLRSQFVVAFPAKAETNRVIVQYTPKKNPDGSNMGSNVISFSGDTRSDTNILVKKWEENLKADINETGLINQIGGKLYISKEKAQEIYDRYVALSNEALAIYAAPAVPTFEGETKEQIQQRRVIEVSQKIQEILGLVGIEISEVTALRLAMDPKSTLGRLGTLTGQVANVSQLLSSTKQGNFIKYLFTALLTEPTIRPEGLVIYNDKEYVVKEVKDKKVLIGGKWISQDKVEPVISLESKNPFRDVVEGQVARIKALARAEIKLGGVKLGTGTRNINNQLLYKYSDTSKFTEQYKVLRLAETLKKNNDGNYKDNPQEILDAAEYVNTLSKMAFQWNSEWLGAFNRLSLGEKVTPEMLPPGLNDQERKIITDIYNKRRARYTNGGDLRSTFKVEIIDGITHGIRRGTSAEIDNMTPKEMEITKVGLFQNNGNKKVAKFVYMTPSENTVIPVIHASKKEVKIMWDEAREGSSAIGLQQEATDALYSIYEAEMLRIKSFEGLSEEERNIAGYKDGADKFLMLPFLNREEMKANMSNQVATIWNSEGKIIIPGNQEQKAKIKSVITRHVMAAINAQVKDWESLGMFSVTTDSKTQKQIWDLSGFSDKYIRELRKGRESLGMTLNDKGATVEELNHRLVLAAAADYVVNYMFAYKEMFQVMSGDPAFYYKGKEGSTLQDNLMSTFANLNKRISEVRASGQKGYWNNPLIVGSKIHAKKANELSIIIAKDREVASKNIDQMKKMSKKLGEAYGANPSTDAQSLITMSEHLATLMAYGKISDKDFLVLTEKYEKQLAALKKIVSAKREGDKKAEKQGRKELRDAKYTYGEMREIIMQPLKPVYTGFKMEPTKRAARAIYLKTSSFPLVPQVVEGLEIENVLLALEEVGADMLIYKTGVKTGASNEQTIWDSKGDLKTNLSFKGDDVVRLSRSEYKIQQDNPYKGAKKTIRESTQGQKMLFENLFGKSKNGTNFDELRGEFNETQRRILEKKYHNFLESIGAKVIKKEIEVGQDRYEEVEEVYIEDLSRLRRVLVEEAMERGYPLNDLLALGLTEMDTKFDLPLGFHMSAFRMEPLVLSIIKNKILKSELPGNTYIQGSGAGFKGVKGFNELSSEEKSDITWIPGFNPEEGLNYMLTEGDKVKKAQIIVPWTVKDQRGNIIRISDYTKTENGKITLDMSKMEDSVLDLFGFRIPLQGHSSMATFEIVGFLPQYQGDLAIVPDEITTQMGSDFDVDKLSTYKYWTYITDEGRLVKYASKEHAEDLHKREVARAEKAKEEGKEPKREPRSVEDIYLSIRNDIKGLQNRVIEIYNEVMMTPEAVIKGLTPLDEGKEAINKVGEELEKLQTRDQALPNFITPTAQRDFFFINKDGATGMGVFSLFNTFLAQAQTAKIDFEYKVEVEDGDLKRSDNKPLRIKFKGEDQKTIIEGNSVSAVGLVSKPGTKNDVSSGFQSASMDNGNDQALHKLNMNGNTFGISLAMISQGFDERYIGYFANQEAVKMWDRAYTNKSSKVTEDTIMGRVRATEEAIEDTRQFILKKIAKVKMEGEIVADEELITPQDYLDKAFSLKEMGEMLETAPDNKGTAYWKNQLIILEQFEIINQMGDDISMAQNVTNTNQPMRHPGKSILQALELKNRFVEALSGSTLSYLKGINQLIGDVHREPNGDVYITNPNGFIGASAMYGEILATKLFKSLFPYESPAYVNAVDSIQQLGGINSMPTERKAEIFTDLKQYINADIFEQVFGEDPAEARERLQFDTISEKTEKVIRLSKFSLPRTIQALQKTSWGRRSKLLKRLYPRISEDLENVPSRIEYMASGNEKIDEPDLIRELYSWLQSDEQVPLVEGKGTMISLKDLAKDLIKYEYATGGVQSPTNFIRIIPYPILMDLGYPEAIREVDLLNTFILGPSLQNPFWYLSPSNFVRQYFQHKPYRATKITTFDKKNQIKNKETIKLKGTDADVLQGSIPKENNKFVTTIEAKNNKKGNFYTHFLTYRNNETKQWELYEKMAYDDNYTIYKRISTLGTFQDSEFNANEPFAISQDSSNKPEEISTPPESIFPEGIPVPNSFNETPREGDGEDTTEPTTGTILNKIKAKTDKERAEKLLDDIAANSNSDYHKNLAAAFKSVFKNLPEDIALRILVIGGEGPIGGGAFGHTRDKDGNYRSMTLKFQRASKDMWQSKLSPENQRYLEETVILHEFVHLLTSTAINRIELGIASAEEKKVIKKLEKLKAHTLEALVKSGPETEVIFQGEVWTLGEMFPGKWDTEESRREFIKQKTRDYLTNPASLSDADSAILYPLMDLPGFHSVDEFLPGTNTSETLMSFMMQQKVPTGYQKGKGLFDTLMKILSELIGLYNKENPLADKAVSNSTFEAAISETMNLIALQEDFYKGDTTEVSDGEFIQDEDTEEEEAEEEDTLVGRPRYAVTDKTYTPRLLMDNPDNLYVFGDNFVRKGKGGQAVIRDEVNAIGLRTKVSPTTKDDAYFYDEFFEDNKAIIDEDIAAIKKASIGMQVQFPKGGLGTGLSKLKEKAPKTYEYLKKRLIEEFGFDNDLGTIDMDKIGIPYGDVIIDAETEGLPTEELTEETEEGPYTSTINGIDIETGNIKLSPDQVKALQKMADFVDGDKAKIFSLRGYAGTGKTTIVKFLMQYIGKSKGRYNTVVLGTPTHKANAVLDASMNKDKESIGISNIRKAQTIASLLQNKKTENAQGQTVFVTEELNANRLKKDLPVGSYVILDEASMIQNSQINTIMELAKKRDLKIITMGDPMQLPPPSGANRLSVALNAKNQYELTEVKRQEGGNPLLETLGVIRANKLNVVDKFSHQTAINKKGEGIEWVATDKEFNALINEYMNNPLYKDNISFTKIIAYTNQRVHSLNQTARVAAWGKDATNRAKYIAGEPIMGYSDSGHITNNGDYQIKDATEIINRSQNEVEDVPIWGPARQAIQRHMQMVGMAQSIDDLKFTGVRTTLKQRFTPEIEESMEQAGTLPQAFSTTILDFDSNSLGNRVVIDALFRLEMIKTNIWAQSVHPLTGEAFSSNPRIAKGQKYGAATAIDEEINMIKAAFQFDEEIYQNKALKDGGAILPKSEAMKKWPQAFDGGRFKGKKFGLVQFNKSVDYGYAITAHKSQGSTYTNVLIDWDNMERGRNIIKDAKGQDYMHTRNSLKYVALSRASQRAVILSNKTVKGNAPTTELKAEDPVTDAGLNDLTENPLDLFGEMTDIKESPLAGESLAKAKKKTIYAGAFISRDTHRALLEKFPAKHKNVYMHHSTIQFRPDQNVLNGLPYEGTIDITVTGIVEDEKGQALLVDNPHSLVKYPHITVSTAEGVSPKYSNELIKKAVRDKTIKMLPEPITIKAKVGLAMKDGNIWYSKDQQPQTDEPVTIRNLSLSKIARGYGLLNLAGGRKLFTSQLTASKRAAKIEKENPGVVARVINDGERGYIIVLTDDRGTKGPSKASPMAKGKQVDSATRLIISSLENQIAGLQRRIARASALDDIYKKAEPIAPLEKRVATIREQLDTLIKEQTSATTLEIAREQLAWVSKLLAREGTISDLDTAIKVIKSWQGVMDRVTRETEFSGYDFGDIATTLHNLETRWTKAAQNVIGNQVSESSGLDLTIKEIFGPQFDTGWFASQTRGAFSSQIPIVRIVDKWLQESVIRAANEFEGYVNEINDEISKLEVSPGNLQEKFDKLAQKGEDGKPTGNLISKIKIEYFRELGKRRAKLRRAGRSQRAANLAYKKHIKWLYGETGTEPNVIHIDINRLIDGKEIYDPRYNEDEQKVRTAKEIAEYREELIKQFMDGDPSKKESATEIVDALIEQQKQQFQDYLENRRQIIEDYEVKYEDANEQLNNISKWEGQNNPFYYNEQIENVLKGNPLPQGFNFRYNFASRYVPSMPAPKHWDPEFEKVMKDPALKRFYQYYVDTMEKLWGYLPDNSDISKNRIPDLVKDLTEKYSDSALRGIASGLNNSLVKLITDRTEAEVEYGTIDPETGQAMPSIPLWMTGEHLMAEQKSYDLGKILKAFAAMATNYKYKARVEPQVLLANRLLGTIKEATETGSGGKQTDKANDLMQKSQGLLKAKKQLQYTIESLLYGMTKDPGKPVSILGKQPGFMTTESKEQLKVIVDANEKFKEALKEGEATQKGVYYTEAYSQYKEDIKKLPKGLKSFIYSQLNKKEEYEKQLGKETVFFLTDDNIEEYNKEIRKQLEKPVTGQSIGNSLITYTQALGMGFNWFSATANLVFGTSAVFRHAAGKSEFTPADARKAFSVMMGSTINGGKYSPTKMGTKVRNLMQNFDGLAQVVETMYGSDDSRSQNWLYILQERSEFFVYGQILVAMMMHNKVVNNKGEEKPLWDAFDEAGDWKAKEFPIKDNKGWDKFSTTEAGSEAWIKFKRKFDVTARKIHGNYDRKSPILGKKGVLGRMLFQFRSWVPELWFDRWEDQRWDEALERYSKGTWRTYGTALESTGAAGFASMMMKQFGLQLIGKDASEFEDLSEIDQINMRKNIAELYFVAALAIALWLLGQIELEGDDEETLYLNMGMTLLLNTFNRVNTEITFFINPDAMLKMTKGQPFPALGTVSNLLIDIPSALLKQLSGEGEYKTGVRKGHNRLLKESLELIPLGNQYYKFHYMTHTKMAN